MKIRCIKNSIRIRVVKSDLKLLEQQGFVEEFVDFGTEIFKWSLVLSEDLSKLSSSYSNQNIQINIPLKMGNDWIHSNEVGLQSMDGNVALLLEKDFPCKDREEEDKNNTFWELNEENKTC